MRNIQKNVSLKQVCNIFGFTSSDSLGKISFSAVQAAAAFSDSFTQIFFSKDDVPCLIPCGVDQDPYFRMARDVAKKLGYTKPAVIHSKFIPSLRGAQHKMSSTACGATNSTNAVTAGVCGTKYNTHGVTNFNERNTIYLNDSANIIKKKINKYAFSGGKATVEEHRKLGGNPYIDISYIYLTFLLEDDDKLENIKLDFISGKLLVSELKKILISLLQNITENHIKNKDEVTFNISYKFMEERQLLL